MTILIVGATGATGRLLVEQLLKEGHKVKAIVRSPEKLAEAALNNANLTVITASVLDLDDVQLREHVRDCDAIASCLGHNLTFRGIYGQPLRLVTEALIRLSNAVKEENCGKTVKYILMNTTGNQNRDLKEKLTLGEKMVLALIRLMLPPHRDNEEAADYLRNVIGQSDSALEWVVLRPDTLIDSDFVSEREVFPSPVRSAIFNAGKTSRINVARFMADLIIDGSLWSQWKGQMPVLYNKES